MDEGEGSNSRHAQNVRDSWYDDNTASATGGTSHHMRNAEEQATKETAPGNGFGSFGEKNGDTDEGSSAANADARENGVQSDNAINRARDFINSVNGGKNLTGKDKGKKKGFFKVGGPIMAIMMALGGYGGASFFGQMAMPISLVSQFQGNFDSIGTSAFTRSAKMTKWMLHPDTRNVSSEANKFVKQHSKIYQFFTGDTGEKYFKITDRQKTKLAKHNIEVVDDDAVGQVMRYTAPDGKVTDVVADSSKATGGRVLIDDFYDSDVNFRQEYHKGTRTWRQAVADWFDNLSKGFMDRVKVLRNRFFGFKNGTDDESAKVADYEDTVKKAVDGDYDGKTGNGRVWADDVDQEVPDAEGDGTHTETHTEAGLDSTSAATLDVSPGQKASDVSKNLNNFVETTGAKVAGIAGKAVSMVCAASEIIGAINLLVIAGEAIQILQITSTILEGIQKTQVTDSKESPLHEISNSLTKRKKITYKTDGGGTAETNGSAMSANAVSALYGNHATNAKDPSVNSFNLTDSISSIMSAIGSSITAYKSCTIAKLGAATIDLVISAASTAADVAAITACVLGGVESFGLSCLPLLGKKLVELFTSVTLSVAFSEIIKMIVPMIIGKVATMLTRDLATDIGGEDFGNALVMGANKYMGSNAQTGGQSLATEETLTAYLQYQETFIADKARLERETKSPFDASSPYTFMGSLLSRSVPILTQTSSIMSGISNIAMVTGNALSSIMPGASAMTAAKTARAAAENTAAICPELDSIGAVGDAFCNPYFITDFDTIETDPANISYQVCKWNNKNFVGIDDCDSSDGGSGEDNAKINTDFKESKLMKYIVFCGERSSPFGMADQNIAGQLSRQSGSIESAIPVWGSIADMMQNTDVLQNFGLVSGEACVTKNSGNLGSEVFTWKEARIYQRYMEDQRLAESEGLIEKSAVAVALDEYYTEHPLDNSFEGIIARYSGMTKEKVTDTIAILEGMVWLANYDPADYFPLGPEEEKEEKQIAIEDNSTTDSFTLYNIFFNRDEFYDERLSYSIAS